jgi:hypothetical protein
MSTRQMYEIINKLKIIFDDQTIETMMKYKHQLKVICTYIFAYKYIIIGNCIITFTLSFIMNILNITEHISHLLYILSFIMSAIYFMFNGVTIYILINEWKKNIDNKINELWDLVTEISLKNSRILKEYNSVYLYHKKDILASCIDNYRMGKVNIDNKNIDEYVKYVMATDATNKLQNNEWLSLSIKRIMHNITLCYYLSFMTNNDELEMKQGTFYLNTRMESISNKRNRKIETLLNVLPIHSKTEFYETWNIVKINDTNKMITLLPCKWIMNEYREMFKYFFAVKYFNNIYTTFDKDYNDLENVVNKLCIAIQHIFRRQYITLPTYTIDIMNMLNVVMILVINVLCASINNFSLMTILQSMIINITINTILLCINNISNKLNEPYMNTHDIMVTDSTFEKMFSEMKLLTIN